MTQSTEQERQAFETWWQQEMNTEQMDLARTGYPMTPPEKQMYKCVDTERAWLTWQAARRAQVVPKGTKQWAPEEIEDGCKGIRWVSNEGIHGRPTDHDVREYLLRTPTACGCLCEDCREFYPTTPQPPEAAPVRLPEHTDPIGNFQEGQWWIIELDKIASQSSGSTITITGEMKRAINVVHHML